MQTKLSYFWFIPALIFGVNNGFAKSFKIRTVPEYEKIKNITTPGDTLIWENGHYKDIDWTIDVTGVTVLAEKPGQVTFSGSSAVKITADKVIFSGFQFKDGSTKEDVIKVSGNQILVREVNISGYDSHYYFHITQTGSYNTVENCNFENKPAAPEGKEGTSVFQVAVDSIHPGYHVIRYCSFKNHTAPPNSGGDYGMEALRIGYSFQSKFISRTTVEYCLFTKCNGDGEIISNKAREDVFRYNTFKDNGESHLTLRHGSNNVVYGNFFLNGAGVRIKEGQNQMVYNNYFNTGKYFSLRLENYKVDPLKNIQIVHNIFAQSGFMKLGGKGDYPPKKVIFCMNLIINSIDPFITDQSGSEVCQGNAIQPEWSLDLAGFTTIKSTIQPNSAGLLQPEKQISKIKYGESAFNLYDIPELGDDPLIDLDIMGNKRPSSFSKKDPGCFQIGGEKQVRPYADGSNTGPSYLKD